jgi:hypothetical protein
VGHHLPRAAAPLDRAETIGLATGIPAPFMIGDGEETEPSGDIWEMEKHSIVREGDTTVHITAMVSWAPTTAFWRRVFRLRQLFVHLWVALALVSARKLGRGHAVPNQA